VNYRGFPFFSYTTLAAQAHYYIKHLDDVELDSAGTNDTQFEKTATNVCTRLDLASTISKEIENRIRATTDMQ
jgi:hypothetical protein